MLLRIDLQITNPMAGKQSVLTYQFDPVAMTQAKWTAAYNTVKGKIDEVVNDAAVNPNEPQLW
jgi:ribosomal protein L11 methylase PrmA